MLGLPNLYTSLDATVFSFYMHGNNPTAADAILLTETISKAEYI